MNYYDLRDDQRKAMNLDSDLGAALEYNPQPFNLLDIERVLAVVDGEHDESAWHWIIKLVDGRYVYMTGSCDYTGWD